MNKSESSPGELVAVAVPEYIQGIYFTVVSRDFYNIKKDISFFDYNALSN